jgi:hypothetical protein
MEDFGACYGVIVNDYELRQGLVKIREIEQSRRSRQAMSWSAYSWLIHAVRGLLSGAGRKSLHPEPFRVIDHVACEASAIWTARNTPS